MLHLAGVNARGALYWTRSLRYMLLEHIFSDEIDMYTQFVILFVEIPIFIYLPF